jgi:uncharacterized protein
MNASLDRSRPVIDTEAFARSASKLAGRWPVMRLPRLLDLLVDDQPQVAWSLEGERTRRPDGGADSHLALGFDTTLRLRCVRCLEAVEARVHERRHYRTVVSERIAERDDPQSEDVDLLVSSARLDVIELLEDEVIMALPIAPRHERCEAPAGLAPSAQAAAQAATAPTRPNPFAALAGLQRPKGPPSDD